MLSKADKQYLFDTFATKDAIKKTEENLVEYIQITVKSTEDTLRNDIIEFKDAILNEIIKIREDIAVTIGYREMIEDQETRIIELEKKDKTN